MLSRIRGFYGRRKHKKLAIVATVGLLAIPTAAMAYVLLEITGTGSTSFSPGSGQTVNTNALTVGLGNPTNPNSNNDPAGFQPGDWENVIVSLPSSAVSGSTHYRVGQISMSVSGLPAGCPADSYAFTDPTGAVVNGDPTQIDGYANGQAVDTPFSFTTAASPSGAIEIATGRLVYNNSPTEDQTACEGANLTLTATVS